MKTIVIEKDLYTFDELSTEAQYKALNDYNTNLTVSEFILEDFIAGYEDILSEDFKNSDLKIQASYLCCQGDGVNIYGRIDFNDFLPVWKTAYNKTEKQVKRMRHYISRTFYYFEFSHDNRYSYTCKSSDEKTVDYDIEEFTDGLKCRGYRNIDADLIEDFYNDLINYFSDYDSRLESLLYNQLYMSISEIIEDYFISNDIYFDEAGNIA